MSLNIDFNSALRLSGRYLTKSTYFLFILIGKFLFTRMSAPNSWHVISHNTVTCHILYGLANKPDTWYLNTYNRVMSTRNGDIAALKQFNKQSETINIHIACIIRIILSLHFRLFKGKQDHIHNNVFFVCGNGLPFRRLDSSNDNICPKSFVCDVRSGTGTLTDGPLYI